MITAVFFKSDGLFTGFDISGHSGLADAGSDVLCAAVSGAVMLAVNLLGGSAQVDEANATVSLRISKPDTASERITGSLLGQLSGYRDDYPKHIRIIEQENLL